jgi:carbamate kinase
MRIGISIGGSVLLKQGERADASAQRTRVRAAARALAPLAVGHELIICHANGAQIATLSLESENDDTLTRPYTLDVLAAQTQGMIGYWIVNELRRAGLSRPAVALVTQVHVDPHDAGFAAPGAFVGPAYTRDQVQLWAGALGWKLGRDGDAWRRVVPALTPLAIAELDAIRVLVEAGQVVVCGGGGGVAVCEERYALDGLDAVVDSDLTASLLAVELDADRLLLLTDVDSVKRGFGTPHEGAVIEIDPLAESNHFPLDSVGANLRAANRFVAATGRSASIGVLAEARLVLEGIAGTTIRRTI